MTDKQAKQLSISQLLLFVFIPALLIFGTYSLATRFRAVIPPLFSLVLIIFIVLIPCEIGIILYHSKKEHGKYNLQSAFHGYKRMAVPKLICISVFLIVIGALVFTVIGPREDQFMFRTIFSKIPEYYKLGDFFKQYANYPKGMIIATLVTYVIGNGICGPVAEELYFRGFLMPRISRFGNWSPVIITLLFSAYHLFSPWGNVSRILACLPFVYCVYKKKNIYIGMIVHCTLNTASVIMGVIGIISNTAYWH